MTVAEKDDACINAEIKTFGTDRSELQREPKRLPREVDGGPVGASRLKQAYSPPPAFAERPRHTLSLTRSSRSNLRWIWEGTVGRRNVFA